MLFPANVWNAALMPVPEIAAPEAIPRSALPE
jgi:hypothetical protein